eukprot:441198-Pelagomonas_calceolata.AAC.11
MPAPPPWSCPACVAPSFRLASVVVWPTTSPFTTYICGGHNRTEHGEWKVEDATGISPGWKSYFGACQHGAWPTTSISNHQRLWEVATDSDDSLKSREDDSSEAACG